MLKLHRTSRLDRAARDVEIESGAFPLGADLLDDSPESQSTHRHRNQPSEWSVTNG
jgi:hypothetical protein